MGGSSRTHLTCGAFGETRGTALALGKAVDGRLCKLHSLEFGSFQLKPGESLRVGRHADNDLHIQDSTISRFHARFAWDKEMERPVVFDNGSQNGTFVDGEKVRTATPLRDQAKIGLGEFMLKVELLGCADTPAVLKGTGDMVTLFSDDGPPIEGELASRDAVRELLQQIERERRTGTLCLTLAHQGEGEITYCLGRVMAAEISDGRGLRALEMILRAPGGTFRFSRELEPREDALNLWISDYLRSRNTEPGQTTQRVTATSKRKRPFQGE
jgi:hypothetical protein